MMQYWFTPRQIQEPKNLLHPFSRMQNELLVGYSKAPLRSQFPALIVHGLNGSIPLLQTLTITSEIKTGDGYFTWDDRVGRCPTISDLRQKSHIFHCKTERTPPQKKTLRLNLPALTIKINFALGNSSTTYVPILIVNGSLLHSLGAGSPCFAMISRVKAAMAESRTGLVMPACSNRMDSFSDFNQWKRNCNNLGITRVSWPHLEKEKPNWSEFMLLSVRICMLRIVEIIKEVRWMAEIRRDVDKYLVFQDNF